MGNVGVEQRLRNNAEGEAHHRFMNVQRLPVAPRCEHPLGISHHDLRVGGNTRLMKSRLDEFALAAPEIAFAQQQAVAEHTTHGAIVFGFDEIIALRDEDRFDVFGPAHVTRWNPKETEKNNVAILPRAACEVAYRVAFRLEHAAKHGKTLWAGRKLQLRRTSLSHSTRPRTALRPTPRALFPPPGAAWLPDQPRTINSLPTSKQSRTAGLTPADQAERIFRRHECGPSDDPWFPE